MKLTRLSGNPIVTCASHPSLGDNVNGPSLIRAPEWLPHALAKYYLYFAHHSGQHIRLALADHLEGPWRVHEPGALRLAQSRFVGHIASPDVHVDHERRQIVMYFHGVVAPEDRKPHEAEYRDAFYNTQRTRVATSSDGLAFQVHPPTLAAAYFRAWRWRGHIYALAMPGLLYRAADWHGPFERGPNILQDAASVESALARGTGMVRHSAVRLRTRPGQPDCLDIFYSRSGDAPERILMSRVELHDDWSRWRASDPAEVVAPERDWEGGDCEKRPSTRGAVAGRAWQLRDPAIFEEDGQTYLLYSIAGEQGLAITRL